MPSPVVYFRGYPLTWRDISLLILAVTLITGEFAVYYIQSWRWPSLPTDRRPGSSEEQVVLLVADPQIQGYQNEWGFPVGQAARWDIDRYLSKTFSYAYSYSQPDVVIFLGDLMDEGSIALGDEYIAALDRFHSIFSPASSAKKIYIPGDNDIGGERGDFRTPKKLSRFKRHFEEITGVVRFGFVDYVKLDLQPFQLSQEKIQEADKINKQETGNFSVLINHPSLLTQHSHKNLLYPILKRLRTKLILSAHWHKVAVSECDDCLKDNEYSWNVAQRDIGSCTSYLDINLTHDAVAEIQTPTCSYRMGVSDIGYGVLIIGADHHLKYTVLWMPRRYTVLAVYAAILSTMLCLWLLNRVCRLLSGQRRIR